MKKIIKKNYNYIIFTFFIIVLNIFFIANVDMEKSIVDIKYFFVIGSILNLIVVLGFSFLIYKKENMKIENMFLMLFIPISICYLLFFPLGKIPDEASHFLRAYEISKGHLTTKVKSNGVKWDKSIKKVLTNENYTDVLNNSKINKGSLKRKYKYSGVSLYSFVCYIPQSMGMIVARVFRLSYFYQGYFGRIFNLLLFTILMFFSIKLIPGKKTFIFLLAFLPMVIQEASSLSPDALTIGTATLFVSLILHYKNDKKDRLSIKQISLLSLLSVLLSLLKIVYLPICLLLFLLPNSLFSSTKKKYIFIIGLGIFVVCLNLFWLKIASVYLPSHESKNSAVQVKFILNNIPFFINCIFNTYKGSIHDYIFQSIGISLGLFSIGLSYFYMMPLLFLLVFVCLFDNYKKININKLECYFILFIILSVILLISTSLYVQWTGVFDKVIYGIQGRYFLPIFPLICLLFNKFSITPKLKFNNKYLYLFMFGLNVYSIFMIFYHFM